MKMMVLGAVLQGSACAYDLLQQPSVTQVTLADHRLGTLAPFLSGDWGGRLRPLRLDVTDDAAVAQALRGHTSVMSAIPYYYNAPMARAAVEAAGARFAVACHENGPIARVIEVALPGMLETYGGRDAAVAAVG